MPIPIDFSNIRGDTIEGKRVFFEQLFCHLAELDGSGGEYRRIEGAGGDGGVEALRILPSRKKIGYQAKYYPSRDDIDWSKLDNSVETALTLHPELERYVIALPCDFTGRRAARGGSTEGIWGKWDNRVERWTVHALSLGMKVAFEPWTAFEIEAALLLPTAQYLIPFFFDRLVFTREWIQRHLDRTVHDLQARYSPGEHVDTESLRPFDVIYRRENIRNDLSAIFEVARNSYPRNAADLVKDAVIPEADIVATEESLKAFGALADAVNWKTPRSWPICQWLTSWYSLTRQLLKIERSITNKIPNENSITHDSLDRRVSAMIKVNELIGPEVFGGHWVHLLPIDGSRAILFVGRSGTGKSHVLARGAETAWREGAPVIHILGQHILDDDPRISILKRLEIPSWSFHDALSALNLAAEAAETRALLVIDALNEGHGTEVWRKHLASFISEVNAHDRIFLILSCREEYLEHVIPSEVIANPRPYPGKDGGPPKDCTPLGKLVRVSVEGFRTAEEREAALQKFMDVKGIARPTAPVLDVEFFNPLFMSSVCRAMAKAGIKVFPRGLHGAREIFKFVLLTKAKALGTPHDGTSRVRDALLATLADIAGIMVERKEDHVPLQDAVGLIDSAFKALPIRDQTWLDVLAGSDILRIDIEGPNKKTGTWARPNEVVRFSFQRLQDNLIAERLLNDCIDIEGAFEPDAPLSFLIQRYQKDDKTFVRPSPRWIGVLGSLWSVVADTNGKELWNLRSFFDAPDTHFYLQDFRSVFHISIRERTGTAFTKKTRDIFNRLWEDEQEEKLAIILSMSCVPGHKWDADFISERLMPLPLADRDSVWSRWFTNDRSELSKRAEEIMDWALNADAKIADTDVARLAGITLTWLFTVTNRTVRDRATKGLVNILVGIPELFPELINQFHVVDDPYVLDRLLAAGYGAICLDPTDQRIAAAAQAVTDSIFKGAEPPIHLMIRAWSISILERAAERNLSSAKFDMVRLRPPFGSKPPVFDVTEGELQRIADAAGDSTIARSCQQMGDFFTYIVSGAIHNFSETPLTEPPPFTQDERANRFVASVRALGGCTVERLDDLLCAAESCRKEELPLLTYNKRASCLVLRTKKLKKRTSKTLLKTEEAFLNSLPEAMRMEYASELAPKIHGKFQPPERRDPNPAGLWIGRRAYELGWTKDRFPAEPHSAGRSKPIVERIGKKYQWIALEELLARLADNYWIKDGGGKGTRVYKNRHDIWHSALIDPTILPPKPGSQTVPACFLGPPPLVIEHVEETDLMDWPFRTDHFDDPEPWLMGTLNGCQWLITNWSESVNERHTANQPHDPYRRQIQAFVSLVLHKEDDRQRVVDGFLRNHGRGIDSWNLEIEPEGFFAHECGLLSPEAIPFWKSADYEDSFCIASPVVTGFASDDKDRSIKGSIRYTVPHPHLRRVLGLHIPDIRCTGLWQLPDGRVFLRQMEDRGSPLVLDKEYFDAWCRSEGLDYTWVYIGERTYWAGRRWRRTLGVAWFEQGKVQFKNDQRDTSK